mgnify:CR=1 FL=1
MFVCISAPCKRLLSNVTKPYRFSQLCSAIAATMQLSELKKRVEILNSVFEESGNDSLKPTVEVLSGIVLSWRYSHIDP